MTNKVDQAGWISRRRLLTTASAGAVLAASPFRINLLQAQEAPIKIGFPVPLTGPYGARGPGPGAWRTSSLSPSSTMPAASTAARPSWSCATTS